MRLMKLFGTCAAALTLAGCGASAPDFATSPACRSLAGELAGARGATPRDQAKIDGTLEGMIRLRCITRDKAAK